VAKIANKTCGTPPFIIGHSLGGTLAAIFCALEPHSARGLVLLGAPLCFAPGSSRFRDDVVSNIPPPLFEMDVVAGSLLAQAAAAASPVTLLWPRWRDAALSFADPFAMDIHARIERWTLDEVALPGKLVQQIIQWLYHENRLCRGTLTVRGKMVGPSSLRVPTLTVVNKADGISPLTSVAPFIEQMPIDDARVIEYPEESGVVLPHLGILVGRQARSRIWPEIISWMKSYCGSERKARLKPN
jgi:polyhydroxyalkanoate synthase